MIKLLYGDFYSYERLRFTGLNTQNILNVASENGIVIKNAERCDYAVMEADVYRMHVKKLKKLLKNKYKVDTLKRNGASYKITANTKRIFLWVTMALAVAGLFLISSRTWSVKVVGYEDVSVIEDIVRQQEMLDWRSKVITRTEELENAIIKSDNDILWNSVSINGTVVEVYIKTDDSLKVPQPQQGDIVAKKDCVIRNLIVTGGTAKVSNGQTVSKGQVLIESSQKFGEEVFPVKAEGKAIASVWYYDSEEVPLKDTILEETGSIIDFFEISFFGMNITTKGKNDFEHFSEEKEEIDTFFLPIKINRITQKELHSVAKSVDKNEKIKTVEAEIINRLKLTLPENAEIYETKTTAEESDGYLKIGVYIETVEDVAIRG